MTTRRRIEFIETTCKTALNPVRGMPFKWSLNPYRGCTHGCHYCYARASHAYYGLNAGDDFTTKIFVKSNFAEVLRQELSRPSWAGEPVSLGTATDPYQPCEGRLHITRRTLEAIRDHRNPIHIVTKSTLVLRDVDLLAELARTAAVIVQFTITTLDPAIWRAVEPGTPPPRQRLAVMRRLVDAGTPCGVYLAPILPGVTDSAASIEAVVSAAREHGASTVWASTLRLAPLVKEHYLGFIGEAFPDLLPQYRRAYAGADAPAAYRSAVTARIDRIRARYGYGGGDDRHHAGASPSLNGSRIGRASQQLALPL